MKKTKAKLSTWQVVRITVGLMLLGLAASVYLPHLYYTISSNAVINARVLTLTTPIDGYLIYGPPSVGTELNEGDVIAKIHNPSIDRVSVEDLNTDLISFSKLVQYLEKEKNNLLDLKTFLQKDARHYKDSLEEHIAFQIQEAKLKIEEIYQSLEESQKEVERIVPLLKKGFVSKALYEDAFYKKKRFEKELKQAQVRLQRFLQEQKSIKEGLFINFDGRREVSYHRQRMDDISMRMNQVDTQINEHLSRVENIKRRLRLEKERLDRLTYHKLKAPGLSVVWRSFTKLGARIDSKHPVVEILDCTNVYVDMSVHERIFEKIQPGHKAMIKVTGSEKAIQGRVVGIRGGNLNLRSASASFVARIPVRRHREMQILIKIDEKDLKNTRGDFCHVGRNAKVYFEGIG